MRQKHVRNFTIVLLTSILLGGFIYDGRDDMSKCIHIDSNYHLSQIGKNDEYPIDGSYLIFIEKDKIKEEYNEILNEIYVIGEVGEGDKILINYFLLMLILCLIEICLIGHAVSYIVKFLEYILTYNIK